jgi:hypothetical protein
MSPATKKASANPSWFQGAYDGHDDIVVQYELQFKSDLIKPGDKIKIKNLQDEFLFRCLATKVSTERDWIDCISVKSGSWHSFDISRLSGIVKPKRSRRRKPNV